ncbi:MAG: nucleotide exchange factor GrpE [Nanoarchaeales archaeon]|nr:nucleotide exchange factor GrpE [Nanoarchaeales archaeon]
MVKKEDVKVEETTETPVEETTEDKVEEKQTETKKQTKDERITELEAQVEELKMDYLRGRADYDNFRKRSQEELINARDKAVVRFVEDLLPSIDNFEMSLKMTENQPMFVKGVEMIHNNLVELLKSHKFEEFTAKVGHDFNATLHEPIPVDSDKEEGKVLAILKKGMKHKDRIVRPVRVNVKKV